MKGTSQKQRIMLFRLFHSACKAKRCKSSPEVRHEITVAALGASKSWSDLNNGDVDKIKAHLESMIDPDYIDARLRINDPQIKECERLIAGIEACGFDENYIRRVASDKNHTSDWRNLPFARLRQLLITLKERARAREKAKEVPVIDGVLTPF